ncbi:hypothetical protein I5Q34_31300 [Streptomyces sp. AV19]|uniref:hypothetical protein n=1 Tax=Streptomyces sp. AV19 TaxID=2793068 RepID=UPI0018FE9ECC|nr:hypothetical protein [Streptomyces sp. AV19]MBH1938697.1 hypothetical protein [Streptomyces sp. AV19]MDG4535409.1 hypothetical protein [Streptomyces sp. AV19]
MKIDWGATVATVDASISVLAAAGAAGDGQAARLIGGANVLLVLGIMALVLVLQFRARRVRAVAFVWVVLLVGRGLVPPGPSRATAAGLAFLVLGLAVSAVFGVLRGRAMPLWRDADGTVRRRGDPAVLRLWLLTVGARCAVSAAEYLLTDEPFNGNAFLLGLGVTLGVQHAVLLSRRAVLRRDGRGTTVSVPGA